jgi:hypothetical protein
MVDALVLAIPEMPIEEDVTIIEERDPVPETVVAQPSNQVEVPIRRKSGLRQFLPWAVAAVATIALVVVVLGLIDGSEDVVEAPTEPETTEMTSPLSVDGASLTEAPSTEPPTSNPTEVSDMIVGSDPNLVWMDEFDKPELDARWSWIREEPSLWSLDTEEGFLQIITEEGGLFSDSNDAKNILVTTPPDTNYQLITKLSFLPFENFQRAFLIAYQDDDNYILVNRRYGNDQYVSFQLELAGENEVGTNYPLGRRDLYLMLDKIEDSYTGYYSLDGEDWIFIESVVTDLEVNHIGLGASGGGSVIPNPAEFDFFEVRKP